MAFPKLERGQEVTVKGQMYPNIFDDDIKRYYYGGDNIDGTKCIIQQIDSINVDQKCFKIVVSFITPFNEKIKYYMLECEFEEYYN